jgi:hypothetical protein
MPDLKVRVTWGELAVSYYPWYYHLLALFLTIVAQFIGVPAIIGLLGLITLWGTLPGFIAMVLIQSGMSIIVMMMGPPRPQGFFALDPEVQTKMRATEVTGLDLAFLPRLFIGIPARTLDRMTMAAQTAEESPVILMIWATFGNFLRLGIETGWLVYGFRMLLGHHPFPEENLSLFLICTALLTVSCLWPRIPELIPGTRKSLFFQEFMGETLR